MTDELKTKILEQAEEFLNSGNPKLKILGMLSKFKIENNKEAEEIFLTRETLYALARLPKEHLSTSIVENLFTYPPEEVFKNLFGKKTIFNANVDEVK